MPIYYDSQNQPHELLKRIGSGGEGTVYQCADFNLVGKIYHEPVTEEKAEKLRWMAANKNERLLKVAAWVVDVLTDAPDGKVVGFLMPNVKAKEIHELYSLKSRRVYFPEATWHFLVPTAANVARAFYNLHQNAHIMGDVNHGNCVVMPDGTVKLIDCDSYSVKTDKMRYRCDVGVATHLAPELQNVNLRAVEREEKHDNFGLAVIIFQLLFLGRHPFAGNYLGGEDKSLEDCIREYRFAYGSNAALKNVRQPPGTLPLEAVSPRVAAMFERAFLTEDRRPEPREWIEALEDLSLNLERCALHPGHFYFNKLDDCPWCRIEAQTGLMLFPFVTAGTHLDGEKPFNIFTVENLIASFGIENNLIVRRLPSPPLGLFPPSPEIVETKQNRRRLTFFVVPAHFLWLIFLMWLLGVGAAFYFGIMFAVAAIFFLHSADKSARQPIAEMLGDNERALQRIETERTRADVPRLVGEDLFKIRKKVADYQTLQQRSVADLQSLQTDATRRELYKYLRGQKIAGASIDGIDHQTRKRLAAVGVKTSAEIDCNRLRDFYKIDDETISELLDWRERLEDDFRRDTQASEAVKAAQTNFIDEANRERRRIERDIEQLLILLRGGAAHLHKKQQQLFTKSEELVRQISQAKSDLKALGTNAPAIISLVLISIFIPSLGAALTEPHLRGYSASSAHRDAESGFGYGAPMPAPPVPASPKTESALHGEFLTDQEINVLSKAARVDFAEDLYNQAVDYNYEEIDRAKAEQYSCKALRFAPDDPRFLNQLGYALYGQRRYVESLKYLNRSLKFDEENSETKSFISMNLLALKKFDDAARIMEDVTSRYSFSYENFYSLGLAYIGLNNYVKAEAAFRRASEINPNDADTHYQLGYCLYKLKRWNQLRQEHDTLVKLDAKIAQRLWIDTNLETGTPLEPGEIITTAAPLKIK